MKLKCRINENDYDIVQGVAFSEEYNETLDSGSIILTHETQIKMKPYDDVYIWDSKYNFVGYDDNGNSLFENVEQNESKNIFYKHLLVDSFSETMINLKDLNLSENDYIQNGEKGVGDYEPIYEYKIQLFSETKALETVQIPNISITQPLNIKNKVSVWEYLNRYVNMYSPVYKKVLSYHDKTWEFVKKYKVSETLKSIFEDVYSPDFSLNNPNLRDILSRLMITKDLIPYVKNDVIYGMNITERKGYFEKNLDHINYISGNMSSVDYCDNLKKNYSDALSQDTTASYIEYLGFRNSDKALLTLDNMRIETRFPIYKINKIYMCYYKEVGVFTKSGKQGNKIFFCKQDITPLVKLNTERNLLSQNWSEINDISSIEDMQKYRFYTIGYDIGNKNITGWGEKITYPNLDVKFWDTTKTYIENIFNMMDNLYPYGVYGKGLVTKFLGLSEGQFISDYQTPENSIVVPSYFGTNASLKLKSFVFQIEYQAFYNGTVIHTKDDALDNITINDNPSSSLTLLEQDGLYTKEKANRFGNKGLTINARYDDISQLQELGSIYEDYNNKDVIIYHREYQIWENMVIATYYGMHDYVLKNYYTSVYARHRTWNLMPYGESVRRAENKKVMILLSKDLFYYEDTKNILFKNFDNSSFKNSNSGILKLIFSAFYETQMQDANLSQYDKKNILNYAYIVLGNDSYSTDVNVFVSGYSLCMNLAMIDNISSGVYISHPNPSGLNSNNNILNKSWDLDVIKNDEDKNIVSLSGKLISEMFNFANVEDDYTGSRQNWYSLIDSSETGFTEKMGFYVAHLNNDDYEKTKDFSESNVVDIYNKLILYPKIPNEENVIRTNIIGNEYDIYKDNKEVIDMTFQIEPITNDRDILFSPLLMKLGDLSTTKIKANDDYSIDVSTNEFENFEISSITYRESSPSTLPIIYPLIMFKFSKSSFENIFNSISEGNVIELTSNNEISFPTKISTAHTHSIINWHLTINSIMKLTEEEMQINCVETSIVEYFIDGTQNTHVLNRNFTLKRRDDTDSSEYYYDLIITNAGPAEVSSGGGVIA